MTAQKRQQITETRQLDIDYCSIQTAIANLTEAMEQGFTQVELEAERGYYDCVTAIFNVTKQREENDEEFNARLNREEFIRNSRRQEYERLKKEFGDA
jgi:hypothetical protein